MRVAIPLSLYVHLPWCVRKCPYCDFNSHQLGARSAKPPRGYIDALLDDFDTELPLLAGSRIETVFFGGGTPSLFDPADFAHLLGGLRQRIEFAADAEITLEANPGTIERGRFSGYRDAGINRVSLGAQTFAAEALEQLGRIHSPDDTLRAVDELRAAKLENFNLDLMYALPQQTVAAACADVAAACALGPAHISYYQLTLEPGTVFHARPPQLPDEDSAWIMQTEGQSLLAAAGYRQYEVSAYAKAGAQCRHNVNYWLFGDYVGIGAGAHGKLSLDLPDHILRTVKPRQPLEYQKALAGAKSAVGERLLVDREQLPFEFMLNALRLNDGFAAADFRGRTGMDLSVIADRLDAQQTRGLIEPWRGGWRATELGRRFLNDLQAGFLA
jgi:oxygen-independent coproporphyrinogen-3 oxidase